MNDQLFTSIPEQTLPPPPPEASLPTIIRTASTLSDKVLERVTAILLINSRAERLATPFSDLDIMLVLADDESEQDPEFYLPAVVGGERLDLYCVSTSFLSTHLSIRRSLDLIRIAFLHKIRTAVVLEGQETWSNLVGTFDWRSFFEDLVSYYFDQRLGEALEDVLGTHLTGDFSTAAVNARIMTERAIDGYRARLGDSQPRPKWRNRMVSRLPGSVLTAYREILFCTEPKSEVESLAMLTRALRLVHYLQILTFFPRVEVEGTAVTGTLRNAPPCGVLQPRDSNFILHSPRPSNVLGRAAACCWLVAPFCSSDSEIVRRCAPEASVTVDLIKSLREQRVLALA